MPHRIAAKITGVAGYLPPRVMTNADMEKIVDTNDEWIRTRTGIRERHFADKGIASSHLATEAAKLFSPRPTPTPPDIDMIIVATVTPDMLFPATACLVKTASAQKKPGASIFPPRVPDLRTRSPSARNLSAPARTKKLSLLAATR